jgi:hypothetical protein
LSGLSWGGQLAVDHDDSFVHLEVPVEGGVSVISLDPHVAQRIGRAIIVHAEALLQKAVTHGDQDPR